MKEKKSKGSRPKSMWSKLNRSESFSGFECVRIMGAVLAATISLVMAVPAHAAGHWNPVNVTQVGVNASGTAFVKIDATTSVATSTPPACSTNGFWQVTFDAKTDAGKAILSMAMSAKLSGQKIRLIGSNTCNAYSTIEGIYVIDLVSSI